MSGKQTKRLRRTIRKEEDKIMVNGLAEFVKYVNKKPLSGRIRFAYRIVFKRMKF